MPPATPTPGKRLWALTIGSGWRAATLIYPYKKRATVLIRGGNANTFYAYVKYDDLRLRIHSDRRNRPRWVNDEKRTIEAPS